MHHKHYHHISVIVKVVGKNDCYVNSESGVDNMIVLNDYYCDFGNNGINDAKIGDCANMAMTDYDDSGKVRKYLLLSVFLDHYSPPEHYPPCSSPYSTR